MSLGIREQGDCFSDMRQIKMGKMRLVLVGNNLVLSIPWDLWTQVSGKGEEGGWLLKQRSLYVAMVGGIPFT